MKIFHTADWHLGKLVHGVYMTEDQRYVLEQFIKDVEEERPDAIIIAGDLYDRAVPPTEAVQLLNETFVKLVLELRIPVLVIAGNHDSPSRLHFASGIMQAAGLHMVGELEFPIQPIKLHDQHGEVHFHLLPFAEPGKVRYLLNDESIRTHHDAMKAIIAQLEPTLSPKARHICVGHAFVTPTGEPADNTSDSERPLAIGGVEHISAQVFHNFHYTALGHLHQAHYVLNETIRYAGSPLKYSISEEHHRKGYNVVELAADGQITVTQRELTPRRDLRTIEGLLSDIEQHTINKDYVYVQILDEQAVLHPMERIRTVYPNALHVQRKSAVVQVNREQLEVESRMKMDELTLFRAFYEEVNGKSASEETEQLFIDALNDALREEGSDEADHHDANSIRAI